MDISPDSKMIPYQTLIPVRKRKNVMTAVQVIVSVIFGQETDILIKGQAGI